ncbi:MAG: hypothetical protein LBS79_02715 [Tannerella sp.]|jgi:hypothetical protein|nr:hypothetical protein [Tannerella sp.]
MNSNKPGLSGENSYTYSGTIGIDYFEHPYFYLSNKIGYVEKGGRMNIPVTDIGGNPTFGTLYSKKWEVININTTFRLKYPLNNSHVYTGLGPFAGFRIGSEYDISVGLHKANKIHYGLCPELGYNRYLTEKIMIGINASYQNNLNSFSTIYGIKTKNKSFDFTLTLGYNL